MRITNEVLYTEIINIKKSLEIKEENDREQWGQISKNRENIASQKSVIKVIEVFLTGTILSIIGFFWKGQS